jgi:hypothetical protein
LNERRLLLAVASAQGTKTLELVEPGGRITGTLHIGADAIALENALETMLLTSTSVVAIDHRAKSYYEILYTDLQTAMLKAARDNPATGPPLPGVEFQMTTETESVAGCKASKIMKTSRGADLAALWVCKELMPSSIRQAGERILAAIPADYWRRMQGNPGLAETMLLYGIPLKAHSDGREQFQARVADGANAAGKLQIPAGYTKVPAPK